MSFNFSYIFGLLLLVLSVRIMGQETTDTPEVIRVLLAGDPFALAIEAARSALDQQLGLNIQVEIVGYNEVRQLTLWNARDAESNYDLVSFDVVWMGEYADEGVLLPLNERIVESEQVRPDDILQVAYRGSRVGGMQYGLPIQPHPELLWVRRDLLDAAGLADPLTTDDLLNVASALQRETGMAGLCWNVQRRQPLGQTVAHLYAAFGQPLLDEAGRPTLDGERGLRVAEHLLALAEVDPPDALTMAWDQLMIAFRQERCAMTTGWAARAFMVEADEQSAVAGLVDYLPAPHAPDAAPVTPLGTWSMGIPSNIGPRAELAWRALESLTSEAGLRVLAAHGSGGMPRYSLLRDPQLQERYPTFRMVLDLAERGELDDWMRPAIPQWTALELILGTVYHDMLRGQYTPREATAEAQRQALLLFGG